MKKIASGIFVMAILSLFNFPGEITPAILEVNGVMIHDIGNNDILCVINTRDENGAHWFIIKEFADNHHLGYNLSQLNVVDQLLVSPDGKYLGVRSVGEGHTMVEIVDLQKLRSENKYETLHIIDPYPGTIGMEKWEGPRLAVSCDVPLMLRKKDGRVDPNLVLSELKTFSINAVDGVVESIDFDAKKWIEQALLTEINPDVIKSLKEAARQLSILTKK